MLLCCLRIYVVLIITSIQTISVTFQIPSATHAQQKPIIALVDKILAAKKANPQADTSKEKAEIDRTSTRTCYACMYALYGLSEDDIKIVEGGIEEIFPYL